MTSLRDNVIKQLTRVSIVEYNSISDLLNIYVIIIECNNYIRNNINTDLYKKFNIGDKLDNVYKQYHYGDNETYSKIVYDDCVKVLKEIIEVL